jgi:hypothetical protein
VFLAQVFAGGDQKAAGAAGGVADHVLRRRRGELDHQLDDVARGAELAVLAGGGDLAEHVFVEVALGVAVFHRHLVEHVHHLGQQRRRGDGEARVLHVVRVGGVVTGNAVAQEGKDMLADHGEHLGRGEVLETRPAQVVVIAALVVLPFREDALRHRLLEQVGLAFFQGVGVVEAADEEQVGDLLHHLHRVGDAARPEGVPDGVDLAAKFAGEHVESCLCFLESRTQRGACFGWRLAPGLHQRPSIPWCAVFCALPEPKLKPKPPTSGA